MITEIQLFNKKILVLIAVVVSILISLFLPIVPYGEVMQKPYQQEIMKEEPVHYTSTYQASSTPPHISDWEVRVDVTIVNTDTVPGVFNTTVVFLEGNRSYTSYPRSVNIAPGQTQVMTFYSRGLEYSKDWKTRYQVKPNITPSIKNVTAYITKFHESQEVHAQSIADLLS
jgi:hypothetical protein